MIDITDFIRTYHIPVKVGTKVAYEEVENHPIRVRVISINTGNILAEEIE